VGDQGDEGGVVRDSCYDSVLLGERFMDVVWFRRLESPRPAPPPCTVARPPRKRTWNGPGAHGWRCGSGEAGRDMWARENGAPWTEPMQRAFEWTSWCASAVLAGGDLVHQRMDPRAALLLTRPTPVGLSLHVCF